MKSGKKISVFQPLVALIVLVALPMPAVKAFDYGYMADNYFYTWHIDDSVRRDMLRNQQKNIARPTIKPSQRAVLVASRRRLMQTATPTRAA